MSGFRIEVDIEALVHRAWRELPWRARFLAFVFRQRKKIEAEAVRRMRGDPE